MQYYSEILIEQQRDFRFFWKQTPAYLRENCNTVIIKSLPNSEKPVDNEAVIEFIDNPPEDLLNPGQNTVVAYKVGIDSVIDGTTIYTYVFAFCAEKMTEEIPWEELTLEGDDL